MTPRTIVGETYFTGNHRQTTNSGLICETDKRSEMRFEIGNHLIIQVTPGIPS